MSRDLPPEIVHIFASVGISEADIPATPGGMAEAISDAVFERGEVHSLRGIAVQIGVDVDELRELMRRIGVEVDDVDAVKFNDRDVRFADFTRGAASEDLVDLREAEEIMTMIASALETLSEAVVANHVQGPERRLQNDLDGVILNWRASELALDLADILPMAFRHHVRQAAERQRRTQSDEARELAHLVVGFVDLAGFTPLSQSIGSFDLVEFVRGFERVAHDAARRHRARIAKTIGDEVMFVAESARDATAFATDLIETFASDSVVPRGGVAAGALITLHGDYFGPIVNLAARLVDEAVPGEVLVTDAVAAEVDGAEPAGRRMLKGFDDPVAVWSISPAG